MPSVLGAAVALDWIGVPLLLWRSGRFLDGPLRDPGDWMYGLSAFSLAVLLAVAGIGLQRRAPWAIWVHTATWIMVAGAMALMTAVIVTEPFAYLFGPVPVLIFAIGSMSMAGAGVAAIILAWKASARAWLA